MSLIKASGQIGASLEPRPKNNVHFIQIGITILVVIVFGIMYLVNRSNEEANEVQQARNLQALVALQKELSKPVVPVTVTYRPSLMGRGLVVGFRNTSGRYLSLMAKFSNPTTHAMTDFPLELNPNQLKEIGWSKGWTVASGDSITLANADYRAASIQIP